MTDDNNRNATWKPLHVYIMATICLLMGVAVGYLVRGSAPLAAAPAASVPENASPASEAQQMPSLDDMKRMADKQVEPLLAQLKTDPNNADLLNQIGNVYRMTHQFQTAASYYEKSLAVNPKNVGARTDLASCLYYQGDVDGAIAQLEKSLTYNPRHAGTLFNLGIIRWKGKNDSAGAIAAWQKLLKENPNYHDKQAVENLITEAKQHSSKQLPVSE
jgi:tetratricopeptide (TPR) repeat protein